MLAMFAFDVCHDVYRAAREALDGSVATLNPEGSAKYQWRPDRMPRLAEFVCDFARAGERALGESNRGKRSRASRGGEASGRHSGIATRCSSQLSGRAFCFDSSTSFTSATSPTSIRTSKASRLVLFHIYYLRETDYQVARRHLGISELTWADWAEEIRQRVGRELTRAGVFPPSRYFREMSRRVS